MDCVFTVGYYIKYEGGIPLLLTTNENIFKKWLQFLLCYGNEKIGGFGIQYFTHVYVDNKAIACTYHRADCAKSQVNGEAKEYAAGKHMTVPFSAVTDMETAKAALLTLNPDAELNGYFDLGYFDLVFEPNLIIELVNCTDTSHFAAIADDIMTRIEQTLQEIESQKLIKKGISMDKIIIRVKGGTVTDVYTNNTEIDVEVLDEDVLENCDDEESIKDEHARLEAEATSMIAIY